MDEPSVTRALESSVLASRCLDAAAGGLAALGWENVVELVTQRRRLIVEAEVRAAPLVIPDR